MSHEDVSVFGHGGFTRALDREGHFCDIAETMIERYSNQGEVWRIGSEYQSLEADGDSYTLHFKTPLTGISLYGFSSIAKTGNELLVTLIEGGTYSEGSEITAWNLNRIIGDSNCPFTLLKKGGTIANGTSAPSNMIPGTAQGNIKPGGASEGSGFILLKANTEYTLKVTAKGAVTFTIIATLINT